jgi:beta-aspartyl-peptidase (threonine type)
MKRTNSSEHAIHPFGLVVHGGSELVNSNLVQQREQSIRLVLGEALSTGYRILESGGNSLDAVETVVSMLEGCTLFNAGTDATFTRAGTTELDASIMDGATLKARPVAGLRHIRNPIRLARLVMEESPHVMLVGEGAQAFARKKGLVMVSRDFHQTEESQAEFERLQEEDRKANYTKPQLPQGKCDGTVGAVALDEHGDLAAGTSTGGMTNRMCGRVSDSAIIGAGTYANNETCAVSATGYGEYFIRSVAAHDISVLMQYCRMSLREATNAVLDKLVSRGGSGGVIALDKHGSIAMPFTTPVMYRGSVDSERHLIGEVFARVDCGAYRRCKWTWRP